MRIIKPGVYEPRWYRFTCQRCGCVFEVENQDLPLFRPGMVWLECPTCGERVASDEMIYIWGDGANSKYKFTCHDCGYVFRGLEMPPECPFCHGKYFAFEKLVEEKED